MERSLEACVLERELSFAKIKLQICPLGDDLHLILSGGDKPHIGCTVLACPRPSLKKDGSMSATSSVLNVIGHKDEEICRKLAEYYSAKYNCVVVCSGGFHVDDIKPEMIAELFAALEQLKV